MERVKIRWLFWVVLRDTRSLELDLVVFLYKTVQIDLKVYTYSYELERKC